MQPTIEVAAGGVLTCITASLAPRAFIRIMARLVALPANIRAVNTELSIHDFLACPTPAAWVEAALADQQTLLIDHKNNSSRRPPRPWR